ncbi:MAG: alpha-2-macroglobulin [Chloroflexi bacterium]|nr:alpha-2-macroglobulin [Chloroflexota bacterium]
MRLTSLIAVLLILMLLASTAAGCGSSSSTDIANVSVASYIAVAPKTMHAGENAAVTFTLLGDEGELTKDKVEVYLVSEGKEIVNAKSQINGKGQVEFDIPANLEEGNYELRIEGSHFSDKTTVRVEKSLLVFLETDKPIYKPGQTIHIRVITLKSDLRPLNETATIEVLDAKGIKIYRKVVETDEYGMATLDLPLSNEPNLGVWKINAAVAQSETQLDVKVEEYVLPKYEVSVELPKEWYLVNEPIEGIIKAEYSFGKPVEGELEIIATRYVGQWEEYATLTKSIDGETEFEIPAVEYVAGVPEARGMGNIMLDITVREESTGYEETTTRMFTVSENPLSIQIIPEGMVFKPSLPFDFLIVTETPDNQPIDTEVSVDIVYIDKDYEEIKKEIETVDTKNGMSILSVTPPEDATALQIDVFELSPISSRQPAQASKALEAGYSPSGNFIHVEQISEGIPQVGQEMVFKVHSTKEAANFYYEIVSRDQVVFTDFTKENEIVFATSPQMAPSAKLLVYQILPNSEVAADYIPFSVSASYPHEVEATFSTEQAKPGDEIEIAIQAQSKSKVGIVAVDKSVFILAENRLNLQQVFAELERLYMKPQAELHEVSIYGDILLRGANEMFDDAGLVVMSNNVDIPEGKQYENPMRGWEMEEGMMFKGEMAMDDGMAMPLPMAAADPQGMNHAESGEGLAEVERVRQYFPETWLWQEVLTDSSGKATVNVEVPDTITTWMLRAVALSQEHGIGIDETQLVTFQPFFLKIDLPYSSIRGEEFPVSVAIYNYLDETQEVFVEIDDAGWFDLLDNAEKSVEIGPNDIGGVEFMISPRKIGIQEMKITARSTEVADAAIKTVIVEPEGVARENVENLTLSGGTSEVVNTSIPFMAVDDFGRAYVAVTSSFLTQTIDGLEGLLQMPFGCGEQNMIVFAPDVFVTKYLQESGQLKPEIMAKAEKLMITGYQRELTYRHRDGSFSAFGESDESGSLWLTAFVLKSFAQAKDLMYIDDTILDEAANWIISHQKTDGSFESVGFVCHQEMLGGLQGKNALTAYVAIALMEAGEMGAAADAVDFLEVQLDDMNDAYTVAITTYALALAGSNLANDAYNKLMELAEEDENGLHWGGDIMPMPEGEEDFGFRGMPQIQSAVVETTAYATLALIEHEDAFNASRSAKWLVSQRNAYGGYGSTQDTVVSLQTLTEFSSDARADVNLKVSITAGEEEYELSITQDNFDVLQIVEVPVNADVTIDVEGKGEAIGQVVTRYNMPDVDETVEPMLTVDVQYDATEVEVNDMVTVFAEVAFNPPIEMEAGMVVVDISIPTGFVPVTDMIAAVVERDKNMKRYEVAGRKVIFYIENLFPGDEISFSFDVQAQYPVKAKGTTSEVYSYYKPEISGESLSEGIIVTE